MTGAIRLSYDPAEFDLRMIVEFVQNSYWGEGRSAADIERAVARCSCVALMDGNRQVGFARALSDGVFSAFVYDLFILPDWRGRGLARMLVQGILDHPDLVDVTGWMLATRDAHGLYDKFGFSRVDPNRYMDMRRPRKA